jgi:hypothetical protein
MSTATARRPKHAAEPEVERTPEREALAVAIDAHTETRQAVGAAQGTPSPRALDVLVKAESKLGVARRLNPL